MSKFLSEQLDFLGRQTKADSWREEHDWAMLSQDVEDAVAVAIQLKERIDQMAAHDPALSGNQWTEEAALRYVPWYQQWRDHAAPILDAVRQLKRQGYRVSRGDQFVKAYLHAGIFAVDFEKTLLQLKSVESGKSSGVPLEEALRDLNCCA